MAANSGVRHAEPSTQSQITKTAQGERVLAEGIREILLRLEKTGQSVSFGDFVLEVKRWFAACAVFRFCCTFRFAATGF